MSETSLFSGPPERRRKLRPAFVGIILASIALLALLIVVVILVQKSGPDFREGHTVYPGVVRALDPGFRDHVQYLEILNAAGQVSENYLGGQQAVVTGEIANSSGTQTVDVVELRITLLGSNGEIIQEFVKTPVQPDFPLKPREIRSFNVWVEPLPPEWLAGTVDVEINGFRLVR
ncbi:MAG: hypothetical protein JXQ27_02885 [Acidobacteria bacterium]|nr:hypothetical protein [Acidobacteriota bacterium]